jgi:hypothetical protein
MIYLPSLSLFFWSFPFNSANEIIVGLFLWIAHRKWHVSLRPIAMIIFFVSLSDFVWFSLDHHSFQRTIPVFSWSVH